MADRSCLYITVQIPNNDDNEYAFTLLLLLLLLLLCWVSNTSNLRCDSPNTSFLTYIIHSIALTLFLNPIMLFSLTLLLPNFTYLTYLSFFSFYGPSTVNLISYTLLSHLYLTTYIVRDFLSICSFPHLWTVRNATQHFVPTSKLTN